VISSYASRGFWRRSADARPAAASVCADGFDDHSKLCGNRNPNPRWVTDYPGGVRGTDNAWLSQSNIDHEVLMYG